MSIKVLKFDLSAQYGFFKNKVVNSKSHTFPIIPFTNVKGILGSILGLNGFIKQGLNFSYNDSISIELKKLNNKLTKEIQNSKNNENKINKIKNDISILKSKMKNESIEYLKTFENMKIAIKVNNESLDTIELTYNEATQLKISEKGGNIVNITEEILIKPHYTIYIILEENDYEKKLIEYLKNNQSEYTPFLGKNEFTCVINNYEIIEMENFVLNENTNNKIDIITVHDSKMSNEFYNISFRIPTKSDIYSGKWIQNKKVSFNNVLDNNINIQDIEEKILLYNNEIYCFFS